jgi:flagellar motor switch protein FliN/FliY
MSAGAKSVAELVANWCREFGKVMEAMADLSVSTEVTPALPGNESGLLWWKQSLDASPGSTIWIGAAQETWMFYGQKLLAAAGIETFTQDELESTWLEVIRQSLGGLATSIGALLGREITCTEGGKEEPMRDQALGCQIKFAASEQPLPPLAFYINQAMLEAQAQVSQKSSPAPTELATTRRDEDEGVELSSRASSTLNLLMDVEMPVSVSFGRTRARIQDILKLITGSIVELDRAIAEPVEVIVNNCVIARGEVVVIDGNYGVRIQEVMSKRERLQEGRKFLLPVAAHRK